MAVLAEVFDENQQPAPIDPYGVAKRTEYMESVLRDMKSKEFNDAAKDNFNMDLYENDKETLPEIFLYKVCKI